MVEPVLVVDNEVEMNLNRRLDGIRTAARRLLLVRGSSVLTCLFLITFALVVFFDWFIRFDPWFRLFLLLGIILLVSMLLVRVLLPAIRFNPSRTDIALRIEHNHEQADGRIASASQFLEADVDPHPMAGASITDAEEALHRISTRDIFRPRGVVGWFACGIMLLVLAAMTIFLIPNTTSTGLARILLPLSDTSWPARTAVSSLMDPSSTNMVHGRGTTLLMRARNDTPGFPDGSVWVDYRIHENGGSGGWNSLLLTHQGTGVHERVLDPGGDLIEFRFRTDDASTTTQEIRVIDLPKIIDARLHVSPPPYTSDTHEPRSILLLEGGVLRGRIGETILRGSEITLDITSNNALLIPTESTDQEQWLSDTVISTHLPSPTLHPDHDDPHHFQLSWVLTDPVRQVVQLRDGDGLQSLDPWSLYIESTLDKEPSVAFEEPTRDLSLLPGAFLDARLTASDDIQLDRMRIQIERSVVDDEGTSSTNQWQSEFEPASTGHSMDASLDFSTWDLQPGTTLLLEGMVWDTYRDELGSDRVTNAAPRRIQIIDESRFLSMIRNRFKLLQQRAKDLDDRQAQLQRIVRSGGWTTGDQREQAAVSRAVQDQREQLDSIRDEMEMNRSQDQQVEALLSFSSESLDRASSASNQAVESMQSGSPGREQVLQSQEEVRFELGELVSMLGEDEESWLVSRQVEQLIEQQRDLLNRTSSLGRDMLGLTRENMGDPEEQALEQVSREQLELTGSARDLLDALADRSEGMSDVNPAQADAMRAAAEKAGEERVVERIREASEDISEGLMQSATRTQQQVLETLQQMRSMLEESRKVDVKDLVRKLEALQQAINRLVEFQRRELLRLDVAIKEELFIGRDTPLIRLRTNTLSVSKQARESGEETRSISRILDQAAGEQVEAIGGLRVDPIMGDLVRGHEERSLQLLESALEETSSRAEQARQDMESGARNELASLYKALAERESVVMGQTEKLLEVEQLDRRARFEARRLSRTQEEIRIALLELTSTNEEIMESATFRHVHDRLDALSRDITVDLKEGRITNLTTHRQQMMLQHFASLAESLEQGGDEDRFADGTSGSGGTSGESSSQQQGLVPPIAEIKLLRSMQAELLGETRALEIDADRFGDLRSGVINDLATQQSTLAELGLNMLQELQEQQEQQDAVESSGPTDTAPIDPTTPPSMMPFNQDTRPVTEGEDLPDLDELLGLDSEEDPVPGVDPVLNIPADPVEGLEPLTQAIKGMHASARRLDIDSTGVQTQRLQEDVIYHLDRLIEMAQQQQQQQQQQSSSSSNPEPGAEPQSGQQPQQGSQQQQGESGETPPTMDGLDPMLGGSIDETNTEWGALPDRVRKMLQQGRQDAYSSLYERMTIEYYRRLAREAGNE